MRIAHSNQTNLAVTTVEPENNTQETTVLLDTHSQSGSTLTPNPEGQGNILSDTVVALKEEPVDSNITAPEEPADNELTENFDKSMEHPESDAREMHPEARASNQECITTADLPLDNPPEPESHIVDTTEVPEEQAQATEPIAHVPSEEPPLDDGVSVKPAPDEETSLDDTEKAIQPEVEPPVPSNIDEADEWAAPQTSKDKKKQKKNRVKFAESDTLAEEKSEPVDTPPAPEASSNEVSNQAEKSTSKKAKKKKKKGKGAAVDAQENSSQVIEESTAAAEIPLNVAEEASAGSVQEEQKELPLEAASEAAEPIVEVQEERMTNQPESMQDVIVDESLEPEKAAGEEFEQAKEVVTPVKAEEEQPASLPESAQNASVDQPLEREATGTENLELETEIPAPAEAKFEEVSQEAPKSKKKSKKQKKKAKREAAEQISADEPAEQGESAERSITPETTRTLETVEVHSAVEDKEEVKPVEEEVASKKEDPVERPPEKPLFAENSDGSKNKTQESHDNSNEDDDQWPAIDWDQARINDTDRSFHEQELEPVSLDIGFPRDQTPEPQSISPYSYPHRIGEFDANASPVQSVIDNVSDPQVLDAKIPRRGNSGKGDSETAAQQSIPLEKQPDEVHLEDTPAGEEHAKREITPTTHEDLPEQESNFEVEPAKEQALETTKSDYPKDAPQDDSFWPVTEKTGTGKKDKESKQKQKIIDAGGKDDQPAFETSTAPEGLNTQLFGLGAENIDDELPVAVESKSLGDIEQSAVEKEPEKQAEDDEPLPAKTKKSKKKQRKDKEQAKDNEPANEQQQHNLPEASGTRSLNIEPTSKHIVDPQNPSPVTAKHQVSEELPRALPMSPLNEPAMEIEQGKPQDNLRVGLGGDGLQERHGERELTQFSPEPKKEDDVFTDSPRKRTSTRRKAGHTTADEPVDRRRSLPMDLGSKSLSPHVGDYSPDAYKGQTLGNEARSLRDLSPSPSPRQPRSIFGGPYGLAETDRGVSPPKTPLGTIKESSEPRSPPEARSKAEFQQLGKATTSPRQTTPDLSVPKHRNIVRARSAGGSDCEPSPKLRRVSSAHSTDLKAASKRDRIAGKSKSPELDFAELEGIPSSSSYDPVTDKGKIPLRGMAADVYVSTIHGTLCFF